MQHVDPERTIAGCTRVIDDVYESNRNRQLAYDNRGTAWHAKGDNDHALADYTEAIRLDPKDALAYDNRGTAWRDKGDLGRALTDYNQAIQLNPNNAAAYNNRGNVRREKGDNKNAMADYTEAIRLNPKYTVAYLNRALAGYAAGDNDHAIADCTEAIWLDPNNAAAYRIRGYAYFDSGDFAAAAEDFRLANPLADDAHIMLWRFLALKHLGQDGASELNTNAVRLRSKDWPYPVIDLYLGHGSVERLRAAAKNPAQRCETEFYGGEWHLLRGNSHDAGNALRTALRICANASPEYPAATAELKRLKP